MTSANVFNGINRLLVPLYYYYLCHLASGEGIVVLGVHVCVCVWVCPSVH